MQVLSVNNNYTNNLRLKENIPSFGHGDSLKNSGYTSKQKAVVASTTIVGVAASLALMAKCAKYSLKRSKMFKNIKNSYLSKTDYKAKEIVAMGAGSCIGGLAGGYIVDKNKDNRKSKLRETIMQIGNVSFPILTVDVVVDKIFKNKSKGFKAIAGLGGVFAGVAISNIVMNKLNNLIFNEKRGEGRKMKITDFSMHFDDVVAAANYIAKGDFVHKVGRIIPAFLVIPGLEVGNKTAEKNSVTL